MGSLSKKIDLTKHVLVPPFRKLTPEEVKEILEYYNISMLQLPTIISKDFMAKTAGAEPGDVIRIERRTPTGKDPYYRRVIK